MKSNNISSNVSIIKRLMSIVYDSFLVFSSMLFTAFIIVLITQRATQNILFFLVIFIVFFGYFSISWVKSGQTIGMKAWGFKVLQFNGENITYKQSIIRFLLVLPSLIIFFFPLLNNNKLSLKDYYSKTYLTRVK